MNEILWEQITFIRIVDEDIRKRRCRNGNVRSSGTDLTQVANQRIDSCGRIIQFGGIDRCVVAFIINDEHGQILVEFGTVEPLIELGEN